MLKNKKDLYSVLEVLRSLEYFNVQYYLGCKKVKLMRFFTEQNIDAVTVGISGGVDSAVVYKLLLQVSQMYNSPLKKVVPLGVPITNSSHTNQEDTIRLGKLLSGEELEIIDLGSTYQEMVGEVQRSFKSCITQNIWAEGQMGSVLRTPLFYYIAAILQANGYRSIVSGTANKSEFSYIGYFGKFSDNAVDIQPIADLYKSEVYQLAKLLNVPKEIINAEPKGDVWDNRTDYQMIGMDYDTLELVLRLKSVGKIQPQAVEYLLGSTINKDDFKYIQDCREQVEKLHKINEHKYVKNDNLIDVYSRGI